MWSKTSFYRKKTRLRSKISSIYFHLNLTTIFSSQIKIHYVIFQATSQFFFRFCMRTWQILTRALKSPVRALIKFHPILHENFRILRLGIIQILHHCPMSWKVNLLYFLAKTLCTLDKVISPSKSRFQAFKLLGINSTNSSCHIWNKKSLFL